MSKQSFYRYYKMYRDNGEHAGTTDNLKLVLNCHPYLYIETWGRRDGKESLDGRQSYEEFWDSHISNHRWLKNAEISNDLSPEINLYKGSRSLDQLLLHQFQETAADVQRWIDELQRRIKLGI